MSDSDRRKWELRYESALEQPLRPPSPLLVSALRRFEGAGTARSAPTGRALDLACGSGRNALRLAQAGFEVAAVDVSMAALERGRRAAAAAGLNVNWIQADLDAGLPVAGHYDLIVVVRYLDLRLLARLHDSLAPGGLLAVEVHLQPGGMTEKVSGPDNPDFLARPGALRAAADGLRIEFYQEGLVGAPQGRVEALAQMLAQRAPIPGQRT